MVQTTKARLRKTTQNVNYKEPQALDETTRKNVVSRKILILFAHPSLENSRCNRALKETAGEMEDITFHDLYATYPDFFINVDAEQALVASHDVILFQFPFYWYSTPSILKEWQDSVLEHGWAYGRGGNALKKKHFGIVTTRAGSTQASRRKDNPDYSMIELLRPLEQTATICGMVWLPPFVLQKARLVSNRALAEATQDYQNYLEALKAGTLVTQLVPPLD